MPVSRSTGAGWKGVGCVVVCIISFPQVPVSHAVVNGISEGHLCLVLCERVMFFGRVSGEVGGVSLCDVVMNGRADV